MMSMLSVKVSAAKRAVVVAFCLSALPALHSCVPLAVTAASVTAVDVIADRRTAGTYLDDNTLEIKLRKDINQDAVIGRATNVSVTAFNGVVLLTGQVHNEEQRNRAVKLADRYKANNEVASVVNELALAGKTNITSRVNDSWITGKVKTRLFRVTEGGLVSKVKVVTEHGRVYLMGQVTQVEADTVVHAIRDVSGITQIVKVFEYTD